MVPAGQVPGVRWAGGGGVLGDLPSPGDLRAFDGAAADDADFAEERSTAADQELAEADGDGLADVELDVGGDVAVEHEVAPDPAGVSYSITTFPIRRSRSWSTQISGFVFDVRSSSNDVSAKVGRPTCRRPRTGSGRGCRSVGVSRCRCIGSRARLDPCPPLALRLLPPRLRACFAASFSSNSWRLPTGSSSTASPVSVML